MIRERRSTVLAIVLLAVVLVLGSLLTGCGNRVPKVPDVSGKTQIEAVRILERAGYKVGDVNSVFSNSVPKDFVVSTNPPAGTAARKGTKVDVSVNSGQGAAITVPTLVGLGQSAAEENLTSIDLVPLVAESYNPTITAGQVIAQVPEPGAKVTAGAQVAIQVSKGPAPAKVAVPKVTGKSSGDAQGAIEKAGMTPVVYSVYSDSVSKGKVIAQQPAAGAKVAPGTEVAIAVSLGKGVGAATVPNVVGKKEADAVKSIESAGLKAKVYRAASDSVPAGSVIAQLPAAGSTTGSGSEVGIQVSTGPAQGDGNVAVPSVLGMTQADATAALQAAGFVVQVVEQAGSTPEGTVTAQLPVAGSSAPAGSTVVVAVSTGT